MIIGFLGKGGSGKTTLATLYTKYLLNKENFNSASEVSFNGNQVLALDNDHNMDFKFNLGFESEMNWMGQSLKDIYEEISISSTKDVSGISEDYLFSLSPMDAITKKYTQNLADNFHLMVSGPHTEAMMYDNSCSHALTTPLKVYLPLLKLNENEYVIVDEKAGTDGVGTGVTTGFNAAVVVVEATPHGVKAGKQIIEMLKFYRTPFFVAINKIRNTEDAIKIKKEFEEYNPLNILSFSADFAVLNLETPESYKEEFTILYNDLKKIKDDRRKRTDDRIERNKNYNENKA